MPVTKIVFSEEKSEYTLEFASIRYATHPDYMLYIMSAREKQAMQIKAIITALRENISYSIDQLLQDVISPDFTDYTIKELPGRKRAYILELGITIYEQD